MLRADRAGPLRQCRRNGACERFGGVNKTSRGNGQRHRNRSNEAGRNRPCSPCGEDGAPAMDRGSGKSGGGHSKGWSPFLLSEGQELFQI